MRFNGVCVEPTRPTDRVLILKSDQQIAARLATVVSEVFPKCVVKVTPWVSEAASELAQAPVDLLISGLGMLDGDTCGLIRECTAGPRRAVRILIVTGRRNPWVFKLLHELPIDGAFDSRDEAANELAGTLRTLALGQRRFSASFLRFSEANQHPFARCLDQLTHGEILALAVLGDGCDRKTAAQRLNLGTSTINFYCENLHRKLNVHHDRELMRIAAVLGLISLDEPQVLRLGFELLVEHYERAQKVKRPRPAFIAALCAPRSSCRRELRADSDHRLREAS